MKESGKIVPTAGEKKSVTEEKGFTAGEKGFTAGSDQLLIRSFDFTAHSLNITLTDFIEKLPSGENESEAFAKEIEQVIVDAARFLRPKAAYRIIDRASPEGDLLKPKSSNSHLNALLNTELKKTEKIAVFACTAGAEIEELYRSYLKRGESIKAFFADLLGTIAVGKILELLYRELEKEYLNDGLHAGHAISPGDCGWPLKEQAVLFSLLPEDCCGIHLNQSMMMIPQKSQSGIIPLGKGIRREKHRCSLCSSLNCPYRK